jgi:hypothetical protein
MTFQPSSSNGVRLRLIEINGVRSPVVVLLAFYMHLLDILEVQDPYQPLTTRVAL